MDPTQSQRFAYDRIAYPGAAEEFINLRNLETAAAMSGLQTAEISGCRVLEIGCADGANLLPSACEFPESHFVGVDLAGDRIHQAREVAEEAGLRNIDFRHASVSDVDASIGTFDYVLCPGVFSWVTDDERLAILRTCRQCLAGDGIAAISYNTLPGWHANESLREFIRYHVRRIDDPRQQIAEARNLLEFLAAYTPAGTPHRSFYVTTRDHLRTKNDAYLYHEYLADHNRGFYFHEFAQLLTANQLRFVTEADFKRTSGFGLEPAGRAAVLKTPPEDREQLLDCLVNANSRRSMLCHVDHKWSQPVHHALIRGFHVAVVEPLEGDQLDPSDPQPSTLRFAHGNVTISDAMVKSALRSLLDQWPTSVTFAALFAAAREGCRADLPAPAADSDNEAMLARSMLALYGAGLIKLFKTPAALIDRVSQSPSVSPVVRSVAARGLAVVNQWHENVPMLSDEERFLLSRLDGRRDLPHLRIELDQYRKEHATTSDRPAASISPMLESFAKRLLLVG